MNLKTRLRSIVMRRLSSAAFLEQQRAKARKQRSKRGDAPAVHYFHQVDDPYSHLAVQKLDLLKACYQLPFEVHLTAAAEPAYRGSAEHFPHWARQDAASVAAAYGTSFVPAIDIPADEEIARANQALAPCLDQADFARTAFEVGQALWAGQSIAAAGNSKAAAAALQQGSALRHQFGHYQGAMFYFDGEWFWGVDRIRLLEQRLRDEGFGATSTPLCVPEPTPPDTTGAHAQDVLLEYFPSLRSPYTAIGHQRVLELIERSGVSVQLRPVMPMMMRGIPAPREKQRYIMTDAAREGRAHGAPLGKIVDPIGEPVKRAFALLPAAETAGRAMAFVTAYLQAAWFDGIDITRDAGLRQVVSMAGLDWQQVQQASASTDWEATLTDNLQLMMQANLWGVPSFRVSGGQRDGALACWGQDRIWRVEQEIADRV